MDKKKHLLNFALLSAPIFLTLYFYRGHNSQFALYFPSMADNPLLGFYKLIFQFLFFFTLCFVIPVAYLKIYQKRKLSEFGFSLGDKKLGFKLTALLIPLVILPIAFAGSKMPDVQGEYPLARILFDHHELILRYEICYVIFYYIAWEFYFRGFMLWTVKENWGDWPAIIIQTIPSCLIHLGKPEGETIGSIIAGILWGLIALRTRSIWYCVAMHAALGVLTDLFVIRGH